MSFHWLVGDIIKEDAALATVPSQERARTAVSDDELDKRLERHREWVDSKGKSGARLELTRADFVNADLTGANLQGAHLNGANFQGAELLLADLRGASLVQANLQETNLLGADLRGANLEGASLVGAAGLHTNQLAGATLVWAVLPAAISEFEGRDVAQTYARRCHRLLLLILAMCSLSWLRIFTTSDVQFLNDAPLLRILPSSGVLPVAGFYVVMPIALFGLFVYFQIALQRFWESLGELPAVFPDGRSIDRTGPLLLMTLFQSRFRERRANWNAPSMLVTAVPFALAYWLVPATLFLFWARYLVMQDLRGAMLQILLLLLSAGIALQLPRVRGAAVLHDAIGERTVETVVEPATETAAETVIGQAFGPAFASATEPTFESAFAPATEPTFGPIVEKSQISEVAAKDEAKFKGEQTAETSRKSDVAMTGASAPRPESAPHNRAKPHRTIPRLAFTVALGAVLTVLTVGVVYGVPHDSTVMPDVNQASMRRWAADTFWTFGYRPYADLTESSVSAAPKNWNWQDDNLASVKGAQLNNVRLRYAQGYRTFWVNAHLWKSDLQGADFSESDFRGANLRESNLRSTIFDRVRLFRANLHGADMSKATMSRADLRETDLSYARLGGAILVDARLNNANLFSADLHEAHLAHANIANADLRDANLVNADLKLASLQEAYLWSAQLPGASLKDAELSHAILIEANLHNTNLEGADLQGAVLRGTDLSGADIAGADFRGASGLTAVQVCSAKDRTNAQFDDALQPLIDAQCGAGAQLGSTPSPQPAPPAAQPQ